VSGCERLTLFFTFWFTHVPTPPSLPPFLPPLPQALDCEAFAVSRRVLRQGESSHTCNDNSPLLSSFPPSPPSGPRLRGLSCVSAGALPGREQLLL